jgi:Uma2 family endonuclease
MSTKTQATIEDLYRVPENGKAEIVNGELILMPPTGDMPSRAAFNIASSLREFARGRTSVAPTPTTLAIKSTCPTETLSAPTLPSTRGNPRG